ncbi:hypothetical protein EW146_g6853 [Bondarzewia mesenterica]|uniref:Uncharacterized protein n=1 Tax=Bondarzewia mesenterica TaxID=1095465 RepID=A0A4S4LN27_9AGAM|nr:hypothetical protein EW146_g6853 [Bondarzewia mesenterica]
MFSKIFLSLLVLVFASQVHAHAAIAPALGVSGTPVRNDAQRPSTASPCGNVNIASTIDSSTAVPAAADGTFAATITNFNAGQDGSRQVTAQVDATGTGKTFAAAEVLTNGDLAPTSTGSQQLSVQLPSGAKCTGGKAGNLCLASFTTAGGFGNCVVVSQGAAAATGGNPTVAAGNATVAAGNATVAAGDATVAAGNATVAAGNATVAAGNATSIAGNATGNATTAAVKKGGNRKHKASGAKANDAKNAARSSNRHWASRRSAYVPLA